MTSLTLFDVTSLSPLYEEVQLAKIFPDSKFFVDCMPRLAPAVLLAAYEKAKQEPGFDLRSFVAEHFLFPEEPAADYQSANKSLAEHITGLWHLLKRTDSEQHNSTLIPLPFPYIVPGGRFREVYYWDSYFTMLGLRISKELSLIQNMVDNFAYLIKIFGFIPNGNRTYYLGRSQPPFFALMVALLLEEKGPEVLMKYRDALEKEYQFWMQGKRAVRMPNGFMMNRYWDDHDTPRPEAYVEDIETASKTKRPASEVYRDIRAAAESGWDFSSRWFRDEKNMETIQTTAIIPVDLNCLLLFLEASLLSIYQELDDKELTDRMLYQILCRERSIQEYCWDKQREFYFDYNITDQRFSETYTLAAVYPLFFRVASHSQAKQVSLILEEKFLKAGGLVTTLNKSGQQWDAPNGWSPLQWMACKGLINYNLHTLAGQVSQRWSQVNEKVYAATGKMMEKYNVTDPADTSSGGEYPNQDGFGWTNGVYLNFNQLSFMFVVLLARMICGVAGF